MALLVGFCDDASEASGRAAAAADAMGMPVVWRHPGPPPAGRSGSSAHARGVPFLYVESTEADDVSDTYLAATLRLLAHLGVVEPGAGVVDGPAASASAAAPRRLAGPGDIDAGSVRAERPALVELHVGLLDRVSPGDAVASVRDPWADGSLTLRAEQEGVVVMTRRTRAAGPGDLIAFLTGEDGPAG
jgi:predicted deacylase